MLPRFVARWHDELVAVSDDVASHEVVLITHLDRLCELARGSHIRLANQDELRRLFPNCEPGAMPPLGPLYGQRVFVEVSLAAEPEIVFNAGTHTEAISCVGQISLRA